MFIHKVSKNLMKMSGNTDEPQEKNSAGQAEGIVAKVDEVITVLPCSIVPVDHQSLVYQCRFFVDPAIREYYYKADASERDALGNPILIGSPEFEGRWNTKWQVLTTFHRWIEKKRWISLYLTQTEGNPNLNLVTQCELRMMNNYNQVLASKLCTLAPSEKGTTRGFEKFLPFEYIKLVCTENWLLVEVQMELLSPNVDKVPPPVQWKMGPLENLKEIPATPSAPEIPVSDQLCIVYNTHIIGVVSREKLLGMSQRISQIYAKKAVGARVPVRMLDLFVPMEEEGSSDSDNESSYNLETIKDFVKFINEGSHFLNTRTYHELENLFNFVLQFEMTNMLVQCLNAMTFACSIDEAALHATFLNEYSDFVNDEVLEHFRRFFRKNIKIIRETKLYRELLDRNREYFMRLLLDPNFTFNDDMEMDGI